MKVLIVAAGTGGHITPGISIADKIKKEDSKSEILFIGTKNGIENDIVPKAGYKVKHIRASGIERRLSIRNVKNLCNLFLGVFDAKKIIKEFNPDIVIGTGGFVCYPIFKQATKLKIPTMLHESNSIPGKVVTTMASRVDTIMLGFKQAQKRIKNAKNVVFTGTPSKMTTYVPPDNIKQKLGLRTDMPVLLIIGGSQGAKKINEYIVEILCNGKNKNYQTIFVTGPKQYNNVISQIEKKKCNIHTLKNVKVLPYVYNMEEYMSAADLLISRAGALSLTEICVMGKPSILIPYPYAAENHQEYNAMILEKRGAAKVLLESNMSSDTLNGLLEVLINDRNKLFEMGANARRLGVLDVEDRIYVEIKKLLRGKI